MRRYTIEINGKQYVIDVEELTSDTFRVLVDDEIVEVRLGNDEDLTQTAITPEIVPLRTPNRAPTPSGLPREVPQTREVRAPIENGNPAIAARPAPTGPTRPSAGGGKATLTAPMPGVIVSIDVAPGTAVTRGQVVVVLEAMKMKNNIKASRDGVVAEIFVQPGQPVGHGDALLRFEGD